MMDLLRPTTRGHGVGGPLTRRRVARGAWGGGHARRAPLRETAPAPRRAVLVVARMRVCVRRPLRAMLRGRLSRVVPSARRPRGV